MVEQRSDGRKVDRQGSSVSRRGLLRMGGVALCGGLAGCVGGRQKHTSLEVSIRKPFESDVPITLSLTVDVYVSNISKDVALRGVELVLCDEDRAPVFKRLLGDFSWQGAPPSKREVDESDSLLESTWYSANWTLEPTVNVDVVPEWITFTVDQVWFGDDEGSDPMIVGEARASPPIPEFEATIRRFTGGRPPPSTVTSDNYWSPTVSMRDGVGDDVPLLPDPTPTPTLTPGRDTGTAQNGTVADRTSNVTSSDGTATAGPPGHRTRTGNATSDGDG